MEIKIKHALLTAGAIVLAYHGWKAFSKPKTEPTSNASGNTNLLKYKKSDGKVYKVVGTGFDARWARLSEDRQPKPMDWYNLNGKWVWAKWNGKLDTAAIPGNQLLS